MLILEKITPDDNTRGSRVHLISQSEPRRTGLATADWCPIIREFTWLRRVELLMKNTVTEQDLIVQLSLQPHAVIRKIVSHEPIITDGMKLMMTRHEDCEGLIALRQQIPDYIDDFGCNVYVFGEISWDGSLQDEDRRYDTIMGAPAEDLRKTIKFYDTCSRRSTK